MIKAIIFDLDGVILETADIKTQAFRKLFTEEYPDKVDEIVAHHLDNMGVSRYIKFRYIYKNFINLPLTKIHEKLLGEKFSSIILEDVLKASFVPGALRFLKKNYKKYFLFVSSGTPQEELKYILSKRSLSKYFREIYGSPTSKTKTVQRILSRHNFRPEEAVFIGDAESDAKAAGRTGVTFIARIHHHSKGLKGSRYVLRNLVGLSSLLNKHSKRAITNKGKGYS